ncbi:hypothetical protein Hanom_Chr03g00247171 [Helianthus anomalus]
MPIICNVDFINQIVHRAATNVAFLHGVEIVMEDSDSAIEHLDGTMYSR